MATDRIEAVSTLLSQTEAAHGVYETTELNGVYDQQWSRWYAARAVEQGIAELVGHDIGADRLAQFLATSFDEFKKADPPSSESWAAYTARRITAEL